MPNDPPANKQHSVPFKKKVIYQQYQMINNTEELQRLLPTMEGGSGPLKKQNVPKKKKIEEVVLEARIQQNISKTGK